MKKITKYLKKNDELLSTLVAILTSILFLYNTLSQSPPIDKYQFLRITDCLNLIILLVAFLAIKKQNLLIEDSEFSKLTEVLNLSKEIIINKKERVNELVNQLVNSIKWFILVLSGFYILQLFMDVTLIERIDALIQSMHGKESIFELFQFKEDEPCDPKNAPNSLSCQNLSAAKFLSLELLMNSANLFSAAFLFTAFQILFVTTLKEDNKTWDLKNRIPMAIAIAITGINLVIFTIGIKGFDLNITSNAIRLFGGLYNGVAMVLLFSRFISMEFFFQKATASFERNFYLYGILLALPLYVVVQPLYGLFYNLDAQSTVLFKSIVFLVCLWGKLVFLFFVYTMINKRWIHAYLMVSLTNNKTIEFISQSIENVELFSAKENSMIKRKNKMPNS